MKYLLLSILLLTISSNSLNAKEYYVLLESNPEVVVHLKDGRTIEGILLQRTDEYIILESDFGEITIRTENIERIELKASTAQPDRSIGNDNDNRLETEVGMIGRAMLYDNRKKNIGTAIALETVGAGLLYAESYTAGTIMLIAQTGLVIGSIFANDPDIQLGLGLTAIALKGTNVFLTIRAVNRYNQNLMYELGLLDSPQQIARKRNRNPFELPNYSLYADIGGRSSGIGISFDYRLINRLSFSASFGTLFLADVNNHNNIGLMAHYILGESRRKMELGLGFTHYWNEYTERQRIGGHFGDVNVKYNVTIIQPLIGYRYESKDTFLFRVYLSTFGNPSDSADYFKSNPVGVPIVGLSFGYSF